MTRPEAGVDLRFRTYLRLFGRTRETKTYAAMALLFGTSLYLRKGPVEVLVLLGCTLVVAVPLGYWIWRRRQADPD